MSFSFNLGFNPEAQTTKNLAVDTIEAADYVRKTPKEDEVAYESVTSTYGRPERLKYGRREIKDIYANASIDSAYRCPAKTGIKLYLSTELIGSLTETNTPAFRQDFPLNVKTVIDVPASDYLTANDVLTIVKHHYGMVLGGGTDVTAARINQLLKGALELAE